MTRLLLAATLALAACASPSPNPLRLAPVAELAPDAQDAAARLYAATGISVPVGAEGTSVRLAATADVPVAPDKIPEACRPPNAPCVWSGHFDGHEILINADAPSWDRARSVLHETIHALLLDAHAHLPAGVEGVTSEAYTVDCITAADLELICGAVDCAWMRAEEGCK